MFTKKRVFKHSTLQQNWLQNLLLSTILMVRPRGKCLSNSVYANAGVLTYEPQTDCGQIMIVMYINTIILSYTKYIILFINTILNDPIRIQTNIIATSAIVLRKLFSIATKMCDWFVSKTTLKFC